MTVKKYSPTVYADGFFNGMNEDPNGEFIKVSDLPASQASFERLRELLEEEKRCCIEFLDGDERKGALMAIRHILAELSSVDASLTAKTEKKGLEKVTE